MSSRMFVVVLLVLVMVVGVWPRVASAGSPASGTNHITLVLGHPTRLSVSFYQWSRTANPNRYVLSGSGTTKDPAKIARIVDVVNQVNAPSNMPHSCPSLPDGRTILQFGYSNGDVWTVYEGGCWDFSTHGVIGTALGDPPVLGTLPPLLKQIAAGNDRG